MNKNIIYELRIVCRSDGKKKYPFQIHTDAKYYYTEFAEAEAAVQRMVKEYAQKDWKEVYRYGIYTYSCKTEITNPNRDAVDAIIYLPDGTQWIRTGEEGALRSGEVYERIVGNSVYIGILQDDKTDDTQRYRFLEFGTDYNKDLRHITEIMPCSLPVSDKNIYNLKSRLELYEALERKAIAPSFGLPYNAITIFEEDMNDYLYIPASFSGFRYDLFFDCNAAYLKNMHPMWFYVAYPEDDNMLMLPITVAHDHTLMWNEYEHLMYDLLVTEDLINFITFNLHEIMTLADNQSKPDYFLWNLVTMDKITKVLSSSDDGNMSL